MLAVDEDEAAFSRMLQMGLGRAVLYLQQHDAAPYRDQILHACLNNLAYDPQCEGERAQYMLDIIDATGERTFYQRQILAALRDDPEEYSEYQLCAFARLFAEQGDQKARLALYEYVSDNLLVGDFIGADEVIDLDGLAGFRFVAEQLGELALTDPEFFDSDHLLRLVENVYGLETVKVELEQAATDNLRIAAYLRLVHANREMRAQLEAERDVVTSISYAQIRQLIADNGAKGLHNTILRWSKNATDAEWQQAATDLLAETDRDRLLVYLRLFWRTPFPLEPTKLLELAQVDDKKLRNSVINALELIRHPAVRRLALEVIASSPRPAEGVALLCSNFEAGDQHLIESLLARNITDDEIHSIGMSVLDIVQSKEEDLHVPLLMLLYERGLCSLCRGWFVDCLDVLGAVPDWMRDECRYDANRELLVKTWRQ